MEQIDNEKLVEKLNSLTSYEEYYMLYGEPHVIDAVGDLDSKVDKIMAYMKQVRDMDLDFDAPSLQRIVLELSTSIYYTEAKLAKLKQLADMSKIAYTTAYNDQYLNKQGMHDAGTKYSVQQLKSFAENAAIEDNLINIIFNRATNVVENKLDAARDLLKAASKSLSCAIASMQTFGQSSKYQT